MNKELQREPTVGTVPEGSSERELARGLFGALRNRFSSRFVRSFGGDARGASAPALAGFESVWSLAGERVTRSRTSDVVRLAAGTLFTCPTYLKRYWYPRRRDRLKASLRNTFLGRSRAAREWFNLSRLNALGLSPLRPLAMGEHRHLRLLQRAFIVTEELPGSISVHAAIGSSHGAERAALLVDLMAWIATLHRNGFSHGGLYLRNIVMAPGPLFAALDPPKGRWFRRSIHASQRSARDLTAVTTDLRQAVTNAECALALEAYLDGVAPSRRGSQWLQRIIDGAQTSSSP